MVFHVHNIVSSEQFLLIKMIGPLGALLWVPEIENMGCTYARSLSFPPFIHTTQLHQSHSFGLCLCLFTLVHTHSSACLCTFALVPPFICAHLFGFHLHLFTLVLHPLGLIHIFLCSFVCIKYIFSTHIIIKKLTL